MRGKVLDLNKVQGFKLWPRYPGWDILAILPGRSQGLWRIREDEGLEKAERVLDALVAAWRSGAAVVTEAEILAAAGAEVYPYEG